MSEDQELRAEFRTLRAHVEREVHPPSFDLVAGRVSRRRRVRRAVPVVTAVACSAVIAATIWAGTGFTGRDPAAPLTVETTAPGSPSATTAPPSPSLSPSTPQTALATITGSAGATPTSSRRRPSASARATDATPGTTPGQTPGQTGAPPATGPAPGGTPTTQPPPVASTVAAPVTTSIHLVNPDFEANPLLDGVIIAGSPAGWTGGTGVMNPSVLTYVGLAGNQTIGSMSGPDVLYLYGIKPQPAVQITTTKIRAGTTYTLTVAVGGRSSLLDAFGGAAIGILADGVIVQGQASARPPVSGSFADVSTSWTATAADEGKTLGVGLSMATPGLLAYVDYDNVRLTATTP